MHIRLSYLVESIKMSNDEKPIAKEPNYHKLTFEEIVNRFSTSLTNGLDQTIAMQCLLKNGPNKIIQKKKNPLVKLIGYFFSGFCTLIWAAAIVCILAWKPIGNPSDPSNLGLGILLIVVILLQAAFTAFQDFSSNRVMKSIKNMMPHSASVIRNGVERKIPVEELVVGDLVHLTYGNKVPADIRIIESHDLKFDKSMLTGESEPIDGSIESTDDRYVESKNIAYMTTLITNGQGKGVVVATGDNTIMGKIAGLTNQTSEKETSLQKELKRFVFIIGTFAVIMAIIVVVVWSTWLRVEYPSYIDVPSLLVNTISVMIAFIPEGLPVCVTLSLLIIAKRMAKSRVLVKNLSVIETLSCVNVIASDKTGTLTQNKMFVSHAAAGLEKINLNENQKKEQIYSKRGVTFNQLIAACGLCNNATFDDEEDKSKKNVPIKQKKANGDATDIALLKFSAEYENVCVLHEKYKTLAEIPFNSKNKWMMKIISPVDRAYNASFFGFVDPSIADKEDDKDQQLNDIILLKGAPDYLLKKSTHCMNSNGTIKQLSTESINEIIKLQNEWSVLGQRVLLICKKKCNFLNVTGTSNSTCELENYINRSNDFCIIGLVGIIDPPREGISDVITKCKSAGIKVFMVTGDYALTAAAIAYQIGIFTFSNYDTAESMKIKHKINHDSYEKSSLLLTGSDLENFSPDDWRLVTPYEEVVFARTTPEQKLTVVKEFQRDNYVVGVTGDGVNDAPALKSADIGIAMGGGSEVAMEAAQLVLLDNNFSSILIAIKNGRLVFENLKKVILYLLPGGCMAELVPVLMLIFLGVPQNLSSFQMIIISLFTDIAPSLSLMMEKEEVDLLNQPPRSKFDHIVDWKFMLHAYFFLGTLIVFSSQIMFFIFMQTNANLYPSDILLSFGKFLNPPPVNSSFTSISPNSSLSLNMTSLIKTDNTYLDNQEFYYQGQTVTFVSIVLLQIFGNLLSTRTHLKSFFQQAPWRKRTRNVWIFAAQMSSISLMLTIVYVPFFHDIFSTRSISVSFMFLPLAFSLFVIILDELRKLMVRNKVLCFHKTAW